MNQNITVTMKRLVLRALGLMIVVLVAACTSSEPATPTVSPELIRLDQIENDV